MIPFLIEKLSMGFRIMVGHPSAEAAVRRYAEKLHAPKIGRDRGRVTTEVGDGYYMTVTGHHIYFFHNIHLEPIKDIISAAMRGALAHYEFIEKTIEHKSAYSCDFDNYGFDMLVDDPESRFFYQNDVVDATLQPGRFQTIFAIQTGRGKTKTAQKVMVKLQTRTTIIVRPTYVDKWEFDTCLDPTGLRVKRKHVWVAKGIQGIVDLIYAGRSGELDRKDIRVVILPTTSLQMFLRAYCEHPQDYDDIDIAEFYNYIKSGLVLHDEIHEHFLLVYLSGICMNPPKLLEMSATIDPSKTKEFIRERYMERFPLSARLTVAYIPVVDVLGIYYRVNDPKFCAKMNRMKLYSHAAYEQGLYANGMIVQYFDMVWDLLERGWLANYQKGQKALVFFALIQACVDFKEYAERKLKEKKMTMGVAKYNGGDSYDEFIKADLGVSTPRKAGTAIDIPGLVLAVVTIPIDDKQLNEQITGRPRADMKWGITPKVCFLHGLQISKHNRYLATRKESLKDIVKSFKIGHSNYEMVGGNDGGSSTIHRSNSRKFPVPGSSSISKRRGSFKKNNRKRKR